MRALSQLSGLPTDMIAQRLMGEWEPTAEFYEAVDQLGNGRRRNADCASVSVSSRASARFSDLKDLGDINDWQAEWKWDGIRAQVIKRAGRFLSGRAAKI